MNLKEEFLHDFSVQFEDVVKLQSTVDAKKLISEYVITNNIEKNLLKFFNNIKKESGTWVYGFFGSGKSNFAKVIYSLFENKRNFKPLFLEKIRRLKELHKVIKNFNDEVLPVAIDLSTFAGSKKKIRDILLMEFFKKLGYSREFGWQDFQKDIFGSIKTNREELINTDELSEIIDIYLNSTDKRYSKILFIIDEVEHFVFEDNNKILELQGLIHSFDKYKNAHLMAISQSSLEKKKFFIIKDRFKTKIKFTSEDVETIILERFLRKKDGNYFKVLYKENSIDILLNSIDGFNSFDENNIEKSAELFAKVYPFYPETIRLILEIYENTDLEKRNILYMFNSILSKDIEIGQILPIYEFHDFLFEELNEEEELNKKILKILKITSKTTTFNEGIAVKDIVKLLKDSIVETKEKKDVESALKFLRKKNVVYKKDNLWKLLNDEQKKSLKIVKEMYGEKDFERSVKKNFKTLISDAISNDFSFKVDGVQRTYNILIDGEELKKTYDTKIRFNIITEKEQNIKDNAVRDKYTAYIKMKDAGIKRQLKEYTALRMAEEFFENEYLIVLKEELKDSMLIKIKRALNNSKLYYYRFGEKKIKNFSSCLKTFAKNEMFKTVYPSFVDFKIKEEDIKKVFKMSKDEVKRYDIGDVDIPVGNIKDICEFQKQPPYGWKEITTIFIISVLYKLEKININEVEKILEKKASVAYLKKLNITKKKEKDLSLKELSALVYKLKGMGLIDKNNNTIEDVESLRYLLLEFFKEELKKISITKNLMIKYNSNKKNIESLKTIEQYFQRIYSNLYNKNAVVFRMILINFMEFKEKINLSKKYQLKINKFEREKKRYNSFLSALINEKDEVIQDENLKALIKKAEELSFQKDDIDYFGFLKDECMTLWREYKVLYTKRLDEIKKIFPNFLGNQELNELEISINNKTYTWLLLLLKVND